MRYLITGCAGFIGSHLAERLLAEGNEVIGIDSFNDNYQKNWKVANLRCSKEFESFTFIADDLNCVDLAGLVSETEMTFHLAGEPGVRTSWGDEFKSYVLNNILATQRLLEAAARSPGHRIVNASSSSVYGSALALPTKEETMPQPLSPYGVTKLAAEHLCTAYHENGLVDTVSLRFFTVYGPRQRPDMAFYRFIKSLHNDGQIQIFGDGTQSRDFTFVSDIVDGLIAAGAAKQLSRTVYNLGGGAPTPLRKAIEHLSELLDIPVRFQIDESVPGDVLHTSADISAAMEAFGYRPRVSLREGLAEQISWFQHEVLPRAS